MNNIGFLWVLLFLNMTMIYYFMYINDQRSLLLWIVLIILFSLYSTHMNEILFSAAFIVCGFNLLGQWNTFSPLHEYPIIQRINEVVILNEPYYEPTHEPFDIQEMIYNWNKSRPIVE